jgi:hypothetical protein
MSFKRLFVFFLVVGVASADTMIKHYSYTFDYTFPTPSIQTIVSDVSRPIRIDVQVVGGDSSPLDIDDFTLAASVISRDDGRQNQVATATTINGTNGQYLINVTPTRDGTAQIKVDAYDSDNNLVAMVGQFALTVTQSVAGAGGSIQPVPTNITISAINIDNTTIVTGVVGIAVTEGSPLGVVTNDGVATITVPAGGGGSVSNVYGVYPVIVTNFADNFYIGLVSFDGIIIAPSFTNQAVVQFGGPTNYTFSVPVTVTQLVAHLWGAGTHGSTVSAAGGYTEVIFPTTGGEALTITVGEGGLQVPSTNAAGVSTARGGWPDGGVGVNRLNNATTISSGGGSSRILRGTNIIAIAGAGGGPANVSPATGIGGGISGAGGAANGGISGGGGTQTEGGSTGSTAIPLFLTNTPGAFLQGGSGGTTTNVNFSGAAGGGGGGWYGGGGGLANNSSASRAAGGGGSGYWNPALSSFGWTARGSGNNPPLQESPYYGTDIGGFGWGTGQSGGTRGAHGGIVLRWEAE